MSAVISSEVLIKSDFFRYINQRMFTISCGQSLAKRWLGNSAAQHSNFKISCSKGLLAQWQTSRVGPIAQHGDIGDSWQERRLPHHLLERGRRLRWLARSAQLLAIHLNAARCRSAGIQNSVIDSQTAGRPIGHHPSSFRPIALIRVDP
jgi:hypothetical protein